MIVETSRQLRLNNSASGPDALTVRWWQWWERWHIWPISLYMWQPYHAIFCKCHLKYWWIKCGYYIQLLYNKTHVINYILISNDNYENVGSSSENEW